MAPYVRVPPMPLERKLSEIAADILNDYQGKPSFEYAMPYVYDLLSCHTTDLGHMQQESGDTCYKTVIFLLTNLRYWQGQCAQRIKNELRAALADYESREA